MIAPTSGPIDLTDKVAIVTGASRGIGQATCVALAREGVRIAACDVLSSKETVEEIRSKGHEVLEIECNVQKKASIQKAVAQVIDTWGRIDIMVNNAGILGDSRKQFEEYTLEDWDLLLQTNLRGTFLMTQAVWPCMEKQGGGKVICLGSIAGRIGGLLAGPHYCASKGGIHAFVKWAAKKGASLGIYVNGIAPGPIVTPMTMNEPYKDDMVPLGRLGQPEDIAEVVVFLASQASNFITGNIIDVNGGILMV
ncbi:MAG: 3-oxoacyl-ACP reductase FabG [Desulfobacteraceae bacterium]|nr:3-oxoacyl-ACP reductase FabG [Desulfobacteraceae bacterium]